MDEALAKAKLQLLDKLRREIPDAVVLAVLAAVPREEFVPPETRHLAYLDMPLAIGGGQTISQPYIVALMTDALRLRGHEKVLEIGTGSGYQAAILSKLLPRGRLYTVERLPELAQQARRRLAALGCANVTVELAGDDLGLPERAPYDAIIVTAAAPNLPPSLLAQLAVGGRMVIPVGRRKQQQLVVAWRTDEAVSVRTLGPCRFVPLIGKEGFPEQ